MLDCYVNDKVKMVCTTWCEDGRETGGRELHLSKVSALLFYSTSTAKVVSARMWQINHCKNEDHPRIPNTSKYKVLLYLPPVGQNFNANLTPPLRLPQFDEFQICDYGGPRGSKMVPIEIWAPRAYSTSIHNIDLSRTILSQCAPLTDRQTSVLVAIVETRQCTGVLFNLKQHRHHCTWYTVSVCSYFASEDVLQSTSETTSSAVSASSAPPVPSTTSYEIIIPSPPSVTQSRKYKVITTMVIRPLDDPT